MKSRTCLSALLLVLGTTLTAEAAPVVDARVRALYAYRDRRGGTLPFYRARKSFEVSGMAPLLVRFAREPSARELARYRKLGFERGRRLDSGAVKVSARPEALHAMEADGVLARVTVDLPPAFRIQPLDHARGELAVASGVAAWQRTHGTALSGEGVIIGDMDSSVDPFHPAFFRALAPELWMDVDGDGVLTPGIDGVDRDQSGAVEAREVLRLLDGVATDLFNQHERIYGTANTGFDPTWDYLFLDENGDGKRNAASEVAGSDTLPSMGEPLFASDDVDRDGRIALPERVVPLGGSKFLAIEQAGAVYRRGENLSQFKPSEDLSHHGTLTLGSAAGGQPGLSRFLGLAPDAELLLTDVYSDLGFSWADNLQWLVDSGADVVVTELSSFGLEPSDGSSELELLIDAVVEQRGVVVVSPAGNLGLSQKHAFATIPPASAPAPYQNELVFEETPTSMFFSVTWREGQATLTGSLSIPDGDVIDLGTEEPAGTTMQGRSFSVVQGVTSLGAGYLIVALNHEGKPLPDSGSVIQL
ncbi:MAG TPA: S8 family serine peptidase, partial [Polyangiaceae bacterium]|nr:S8 family serine peptidase [Polyangiaceae bacterium]